MITTLRIIKLLVPVLAFFGFFASSCDKDDDDNTGNNNNNASGRCNNNGNLNYGNCITCVLLVTYSNGQPSYTYSSTLCPADFSSQAAFRAYIATGCAYDGYVFQGSGYTATYSVTCRN